MFRVLQTLPLCEVQIHSSIMHSTVPWGIESPVSSEKSKGFARLYNSHQIWDGPLQVPIFQRQRVPTCSSQKNQEQAFQESFLILKADSLKNTARLLQSNLLPNFSSREESSLRKCSDQLFAPTFPDSSSVDPPRLPNSLLQHSNAFTCQTLTNSVDNRANACCWQLQFLFENIAQGVRKEEHNRRTNPLWEQAAPATGSDTSERTRPEIGRWKTGREEGNRATSVASLGTLRANYTHTPDALAFPHCRPAGLAGSGGWPRDAPPPAASGRRGRWAVPSPHHVRRQAPPPRVLHLSSPLSVIVTPFLFAVIALYVAALLTLSSSLPRESLILTCWPGNSLDRVLCVR